MHFGEHSVNNKAFKCVPIAQTVLPPVETTSRKYDCRVGWFYDIDIEIMNNDNRYLITLDLF